MEAQMVDHCIRHEGKYRNVGVLETLAIYLKKHLTISVVILLK